MSKDTKQEFAEQLALAIRESYPDNLIDTAEAIERPKNPEMGRYAFPTFAIAKALKQNPAQIATNLAAVLNRIGANGTLRYSAVGPYVNASEEPIAIAKKTLESILSGGTRYGASDIGNGKKILVEYSSPNIAKPFGIGHLRSTVIGNSLRRIFMKLGYEVTGINYPGDWGTQFGKMIVAWRKWGGELDLAQDAVKKLFDLYVRFHVEAEKDKSLNEEARIAFKQLEDGAPEAVDLWETFKTISHAEFNRIYSLLGVEFDLVYGESFLNDKMDAAVDRLTKDGLTSISQGALVVMLDNPQLPPCLLRKGDGATLYATRDIAGLIYRWEKFHFHESLYVVGVAQSDHFKQAFIVIDKMERAEGLSPQERMTGRVKHIDFGWVKFGETMMSTRLGNIIFLEDVINEAVKLVAERISEKNPNLSKRDVIAMQVGTGAVIFSQLSVRRQKDVSFIWDQVLNFEGETGPYLQYTHARLCSLIRNWGRELPVQLAHPDLLNHPEEQRVIEILADFPGIIEDAARHYEPCLISDYLLGLSAAFNKVYQRKTADGRSDKIISDDLILSEARMSLVKCVEVVVKEGLHLLGLSAPEEM
ncbi:MAG: arginine--tRNA ligase [Candidatus Zixiibacteriota bacterium]